MRRKLIGYSAVYDSDETDWFIPHAEGAGNYYGRIWPKLREAANAAEKTGGPGARLVAVYEIEDAGP